MKVGRLPVDPGPAAWNALLPPATLSRPLSGQKRADWLVIGAGFAGLSAARRLGELHPGQRIVVLEASRLAEGPAGRNSGFMIDLPHDLTSNDYGGRRDSDLRQIRLNRAAIDYVLEARDTFAMSDEAVDPAGKINGAVSERGVAHNDQYAKHLDALGEPYERLDAQAMASITGSPRYIDGLYSPGTVMLQPALYTRELARGICSPSLSIFEQTPVVALARRDGSWLACTPGGSVTAPRVVLTVNGHLESFGYYRRRLVHIFTYASMTRALCEREIERLGGRPRWALTPADPLGTTVRRISGIGGDRIVVRNRATYDPSLEVTAARIAAVTKTHDRSFAWRFPMLDGVDMAYRWGGRLCLSRNNVSVFGEIERQLYAACCQNGLGTAKGTISGKLIAEFASGEQSALLDDQLAEPEPSRLPPEPVAAIGATMRLRWGEFRAGREL